VSTLYLYTPSSDYVYVHVSISNISSQVLMLSVVVSESQPQNLFIYRWPV